MGLYNKEIGRSNADKVIHTKSGDFYAPKIDKRKANQNKRAEDGLKDGSLTSREATVLKDKANNWHAVKNALASDGNLSQKDRAILRQKLAENSALIRNLRHNKEKA